ncbi:MAG: V-type ATPase subunit [Candidatus Bathyarchaeota archaeon]|nr:V-type ATPase subunit [Candidatus Bathyarchaeota archaeon]
MGAQRGDLLTDSKIKILADSKNLADFASQLRDTPYQEQISKITPPFTGRKLERAFNENLIELYKKIIKYSPKAATDYLQLYLLRFEVENVKLLVKATVAKLSAEQKLAKLYPFVPCHIKKYLVFEEAAKASTMVALVHSFMKTPYYAPLSSGLESYNQNGSTTCLDVFLDAFYYEHLYQAYQKLPRREKSHAHIYASIENDGYILISLLRAKNLNYDSNWLRLAIPQNYFNLTRSIAEAILSAQNFEAAYKVALASRYSEYFSREGTPEVILAAAERAFKEARLKNAKSGTITTTFNIGMPLAFITQKEAEVYNLRAVALGIDGELQPDLIRNQLLF